ncbi:MAG: hypothetical protein H6922_06690 [Pseudomonadaceae bacterium]|nr:hypothetical protein [Pseudomonadaceae bacterium]
MTTTRFTMLAALAAASFAVQNAQAKVVWDQSYNAETACRIAHAPTAEQRHALFAPVLAQNPGLALTIMHDITTTCCPAGSQGGAYYLNPKLTQLQTAGSAAGQTTVAACGPMQSSQVLQELLAYLETDKQANQPTISRLLAAYPELAALVGLVEPAAGPQNQGPAFNTDTGINTALENPGQLSGNAAPSM